MSSLMFRQIVMLSTPDNENSPGSPPHTRSRGVSVPTARLAILERGAARAVRFGGAPIVGVS
jgi:hypothetical protein